MGGRSWVLFSGSKREGKWQCSTSLNLNRVFFFCCYTLAAGFDAELFSQRGEEQSRSPPPAPNAPWSS